MLVESQSLICRRIPKLNSQQVKICESGPDILPVIRTGIQLALTQCERFFRSHQNVHHAWNCSSWIQNSTNRLYIDITHPEVTGKHVYGPVWFHQIHLNSILINQALRKLHLHTPYSRQVLPTH